MNTFLLHGTIHDACFGYCGRDWVPMWPICDKDRVDSKRKIVCGCHEKESSFTILVVEHTLTLKLLYEIKKNICDKITMQS